MNVINKDRLNQIREKTILENALSMYSLRECKFQKGNMEIKWFYVKQRQRARDNKALIKP